MIIPSDPWWGGRRKVSSADMQSSLQFVVEGPGVWVVEGHPRVETTGHRGVVKLLVRDLVGAI